MSDTLIKSVIAGSAPVIIPGTPGHPAYTIEVPTYVPVFGTIPLYDEYGHLLGTVYGFIRWDVVINVVSYPAVAGTPDRIITPGTADNFNIGWNSGAVSIVGQAGNTMLQFSIPWSDVGTVTGIGAAVNDGSYQNIAYGIYCASGQYIIYEKGIPRTSAAAYASTDVFTIARAGVEVKYYKGSTLIYTSTAPSYGTVFASSALYFGMDEVDVAAWASLTGSFAPVYGTCAGTLRKVTGFSSDSATIATVWPGTLRKITGSGQSYVTGSCAGSLRKVKGQAFNFGGSTFTEGSLRKITGYGEDSGIIHPQFSETRGYITRVQGFSAAVGSSTVSCAGSINKIGGFSATIPGGWGYPGTMKKIRGYAATGNRGYAYIAPVSGYRLFAQGHQDDNIRYGFFGQLSGYSFTASGGAQYRGVYQTPYTVTSSGTVTTLGEAYLQLASVPHYPLMASGTGTQMGRAYLQTGGKYVVSAYGGAQFRGTIKSHYSINGTAKAGIIGKAILSLRRHKYIITASGTQRNFGVVTGTLNKLGQRNSGLSSLMRGRFSLVASGHQPITATYEGYSVTFLGDKEQPDMADFATTRYTDFPFTVLGRFGNAYYGVGPTGIFTLDENTLPASAPIVSVFKTGEYDVGEPTLKRARSLWLAGRMNGAFSLDVTSSEIEDDAYTYSYSLTGSRKYRMKVGRGIEATYLAYTISNTDGADFEINELSPEVDVLRRSA